MSRLGEIIDLGVAHDFVEKSGAWYAYKGDKIGQGKKNAMVWLEEHPAAAQEIEKALLDKLLAKPKKKGEVPAEAAGNDPVEEVAEAK